MTSPQRPDTVSNRSSQRLPPPFLFQGPPSRNASNLSLPSGLIPGSHSPGRSASTPGNVTPLLRQTSSKSNPRDAALPASPFIKPARPRGQSDAEASDALWEEMQNTLAEVELSALNGDHVFGTDHSSALEELRTKQLALAQAWVRSEADEIADHQSPEDATGSGTKGAGVESMRHDSVETDEAAHKVMDDNTEKDILLARKRREANDRYFDRVNGGVLDVVAKLEEVADAMRQVERESKEIWSDGQGSNSSHDSNT